MFLDQRETIVEYLTTVTILNEIDSLRIGDYSVCYEFISGETKPYNKYTDVELIDELGEKGVEVSENITEVDITKIKKLLKESQEQLKNLDKRIS